MKQSRSSSYSKPINKDDFYFDGEIRKLICVEKNYGGRLPKTSFIFQKLFINLVL